MPRRGKNIPHARVMATPGCGIQTEIQIIGVARGELRDAFDAERREIAARRRADIGKGHQVVPFPAAPGSYNFV